MANPLVPDDLWELIAPLLPPEPPKRPGGRPRVPDRAALTGILCVLRSGIPWERLPQEMGGGSGMTCGRRLRDGQQGGRWSPLQVVLLAKLQAADQLAWSRAVVDSRSARAGGGGKKPAPNPTDRRQLGSQHHRLPEGHGIPLAAWVTGAHRHEVTPWVPRLEATPAVHGTPGRPRRRPKRGYGDRADDAEPHRWQLRARGMTPVVAKRGTAPGRGRGVDRWGVERTLAWLPQHRRLRVRYARRADIHEAFLAIGCALICCRYLYPFC
jgi:transposase